ncbi:MULTISPECIES: acyl-CoA thioesterase [Nitrincola]|uniref:Acyl-CoA thioester hydrolase, YbgC/YbaW family n=1 Tax=Nitrincola nitratireducens TaxID=1229521 RepID=W9UTH7_9GAMM|nr:MULTISPECIES: thioesterase family protein [Nitrincola]EXJ10379.1 acyl-CoA thioester hydrolase, YbgC/YbaW family [Nitrincola nitratireducens]
MFSFTITPAFYDTDALGHINNTRVPQWFEVARNDVFKLFTPDLNPKTWELILARIEVDFVGELFLNSPVEIKTYISRIGNSSFSVYQEAWQDGKLGSKGEAALVRYNFNEGKSMPLTSEQRAALEAHLKG